MLSAVVCETGQISEPGYRARAAGLPAIYHRSARQTADQIDALLR